MKYSSCLAIKETHCKIYARITQITSTKIMRNIVPDERRNISYWPKIILLTKCV
jgi:hypothetical protein